MDPMLLCTIAKAQPMRGVAVIPVTEDNMTEVIYVAFAKRAIKKGEVRGRARGRQRVTHPLVSLEPLKPSVETRRRTPAR